MKNFTVEEINLMCCFNTSSRKRLIDDMKSVTLNDMDGDFEAFVTNLGKYNEGMLVGEWVKLPTTEEEMQKVFERIGIGKQDEFGQPYEEWFITDYECPIYGVQKMLGEYENLDKLNYLAALIDELSLSDQEKLVAIMEAGCDEVSDIDDLINLTFNLDCYDIMPGINDESDLGYYYAHEAGIYSEKDLGPLANYIDYERYGRDIAMDEQGRFTDEGYVRVASERTDSSTAILMIFPTNTGSPAQGKPPSVTAPLPFSSLSRARSLM